jgi:TM2 domain-containing membrane protein YozV
MSDTRKGDLPMKNRVVAGLFAILLGGLGIHKFYLGQNGTGILYLVFFWTGIPWILGIIDGVILLTMSDQQFMDKYGLDSDETTMGAFGGSNMSTADEIKKYKDLYDSGAITQEEFEKKKKDLLK